ncbi:SMP-30/gluconolactonase/LRE family protein [Bacteroidota bacterium]
MKKTISNSLCTIFLLLIAGLLNNCSNPVDKKNDWELVSSNHQFPEGPAWDYDNTLYLSNCYGGWITRITNGEIDTLVSDTDSLVQNTNGLTVGKDGNIYACDYGLGLILKITPEGEVSKFIPGYKKEPFNRPNDLVFDKNGNLYFTDPKSYDENKIDGRLFFYNSSEDQIYQLADSLGFPNGIAISPYDNKLYVCESLRERILRFSIKNEKVTDKEIFIVLPGGDPDGIAFDVKGNLYAAHFGSGIVYVISPQGEIIQQIKTPGQKPSNIEFGGPYLKTLYLTEDETNAVYKMEFEIPGNPLR